MASKSTARPSARGGKPALNTLPAADVQEFRTALKKFLSERDGEGRKWADGSCPACREREDIAAALTAHLSSIRADMRQPCALYLVAGLAQAVAIARTGTA